MPHTLARVVLTIPVHSPNGNSTTLPCSPLSHPSISQVCYYISFCIANTSYHHCPYDISMKLNCLPFILISLTLIVGVNLWAIERDREMLWHFCGEQPDTLNTPIVVQQQGMYCE
jgi:hypothetical protein